MEIDIAAYLNHLKAQLLHSNNWKTITLDRSWTKTISRSAGVYAFKENDQVVYVGETGNLRARMNDLLDSRHHTIRRTIGERLYCNIEGFTKASTTKKFPDHIEKLLNEHICKNLSVAHLEVPLGRKELEEMIDSEIDRGLRLNKRSKRK